MNSAEHVGLWAETTLEDEQRVLSGILKQLPQEVKDRETAVREQQRKMLGKPWQQEDAVVLDRRQALLDQGKRILQGEPPYFARLRGQFLDSQGTEFTEDVRISAFANIEEWKVGNATAVVVSFAAPIADIVRNPSAAVYVEDESGSIRGRAPGRVEVRSAFVEDVEIQDGRVIRVAPRYTTVWEDRVRNRLLRVGMVGLDAMADVLDPEQSLLLADRGSRVMVVEGPAGTGKSAVALHRVAVVGAKTDPVLYVVPTPALAAYIQPALPKIGLHGHRFTVVTPWDLLRMVLSLELPFQAEEVDPWFADQSIKDPDGVLSSLRDAHGRAEQSATSRLVSFLQTALAVIRAAMPGSEPVLRSHEARYQGKTLRLDLVELIPTLGKGKLAGGHKERAHLLFEALMSLAEGNPTAKAFLSKERFEEFVRQARVDWADVYRAGVSDYLRSHGRPVPPAIPVTRAGTGVLLALATEMGFVLPNPPRWVVVDEAQSFNPLLYRALARLADPAARFVLSGDLQQDTTGHGTIRSWEEAVAALGSEYASASRTVTLTRAYRLPTHIHRYAHSILSGRSTEGKVTDLHPVLGEVHDLVARSAEEQERLIEEAIEGAWKADLDSIVVIAPTLEVARHHMERWQGKRNPEGPPGRLQQRRMAQLLDGARGYLGGLAFASLYAMAGLEADVVIVTDVDTSHYPQNDLGARRLHTACSRARRRLVVIAVEEPTRNELLAEAQRSAELHYQQALEQVRQKAERRLRMVEAELTESTVAVSSGEEAGKNPARLERLQFLAQALRACVEDPEMYFQHYTDLRKRAFGGRFSERRSFDSDEVWYWPARELGRAKDEFERRIREMEARIPPGWDSVRRRRSKLLPRHL